VGLSIHDQLKQLVPGWLYYPHKIAQLSRDGEPELRILSDLVPAGRPAIDVGANRGFYSYALSKLASRVTAFEPHPLLARFAELIAVTHDDPLACIEHIEKTFDYQARVIVGDRLIDARDALRLPAGSLNTCNVVFTPSQLQTGGQPPSGHRPAARRHT
jgi:hypothetical protein